MHPGAVGRVDPVLGRRGEFKFLEQRLIERGEYLQRELVALELADGDFRGMGRIAKAHGRVQANFGAKAASTESARQTAIRHSSVPPVRLRGLPVSGSHTQSSRFSTL